MKRALPPASRLLALLLVTVPGITAGQLTESERQPAAAPASRAATEDAQRPDDAKPAAPAGQVANQDDDQDPPAREAAEAPGGTAAVEPPGSEPVQVFGWREWVCIGESGERFIAKLDTGALTSSVHAEDVEGFEREGQKWVRFVITDPTSKNAKRIRISAPLVRTAKIKEPGGESESRLVVRLNFRIGERQQRTEFTLNNRSNMLSPVLIGRTALKDLGLIDPGRTYLAEEKIMR